MKRWTNISIMLAGLLLVITGCSDALQGLIPGWPVGSGQSNLDLMVTAEQMVAPQYPQALLIEVLGATSSGSGQAAGDVDRYQFRFSEDPDAAGAGTVWVDYENGKFTGPFYTSQGLIGTVFDPLPRNMTLAQALQLARDAGYTDAFTSITFRKPLTFPPVEEALYAFTMPGRYVLVGALSGEVSEESALADAPTLLEP